MSGIECALTCSLAADAEPRTSKAGKPWTRLRVSVGDGDDRAYLSVSCFGSVADDAAAFVKDDVISVEGTIRLNKWQSQDGAEKAELAVVARYLRRAEIGRRRTSKPREKPAHAAEGYHSPRSAPAGRLPSSGRPFDDEVPFSVEWR